MKWAAALHRRLAAAALLWGLLAGGAAPAFSQDGAPVVVNRPAPGRTVEIQAVPGQIYVLNFPTNEVRIELRGDDFIVGFDDNGDGRPDSRVIFRNLVTLAASGGAPQFRIDGVEVSSEQVVAQLVEQAGENGGMIENAAQSPGAAGGGGPLSLDSLRVTGRDLLLPGRRERSGHPLYSYLLFAGAREGSREERARFNAAIQAFVGQFSPVEVLERGGTARSEINVFYAPVKQVTRFIPPPGPSAYFFNLSVDEQAAVLQKYYDYGRAETLLGQMRLSGNGPFIVSVLRPLSDHPVDAGEAFLVQDLSDVPAELVGLWVDEFKRQVVREATGSPEHLRRFALNLRTRIAVLAEAFSITKAAVAEMFEAPEAPAGGGN
jgi:hypothetical protein